MAPRDLRRARLRSRLEAWGLAATEDQDHLVAGADKQRLIGGLRGTVVELGPGTGVNLRYYGPAVARVVGIEPNPVMHPRLRSAAEVHGVALDVQEVRAEALPLGEGEADAVVSTLVLCGVDDPAAAIAEVRRVLRPGGTFVVYEHVRAEAGTAIRRVQRVVRRPHRWLLNGCEVDRDTESLLRAAGFASVDVRPFDAGAAAAYTRTRILGTCTR